MRLPTALLIAATATLPGCGALSALQGEPDRDLFELRAPAALTCPRSRVGELVIEPPKTRGTLDSNRIMIRPSALQTQYLPDAEWGDTVPAMLQRLLVESLGATGSFDHVGRAPLGLSGDVAMITEIRDFNVALTPEGTLVRLSVDAHLVEEMEARVVARGRFATTVPVKSTRTAHLIPAFDTAARQLIGQMTDWALNATGVNPDHCRRP
ncbi:ABC-type transport auxiliary lipoprotein family protein [Paracoccus indicus]|uniref:ABC-type transport auxiliary lipoprotein family protein n=1 Tax=Paracoccus indicus TaxID=2079229 RepID=UPI000D3AABEA|nr:ABC-type transport auxiliary lipoprotein family protein [Paracoccus indicus]